MRTRDERLANSGRRGGALLEFALATPVLLYLLVGVADFARYYSEAAEAGGIAWDAARRNAAGVAQPEPPNGVVIAVETFCECPFEPGVSVGCAQAVCGDYGPPAQYSRATVERHFELLGRYPGFPRQVRIRGAAGVRTR